MYIIHISIIVSPPAGRCRPTVVPASSRISALMCLAQCLALAEDHHGDFMGNFTGSLYPLVN